VDFQCRAPKGQLADPGRLIVLAIPVAFFTIKTATEMPKEPNGGFALNALSMLCNKQLLRPRFSVQL